MTDYIIWKFWKVDGHLFCVSEILWTKWWTNKLFDILIDNENDTVLLLNTVKNYTKKGLLPAKCLLKKTTETEML